MIKMNQPLILRGVGSAKPLKPAKAMPASKSPRGCCTLMSDDLPDRQFPNVTRAECIAMQDAHPGTTASWVQGECA